jgi:uncharacterized YigZ family protein
MNFTISNTVCAQQDIKKSRFTAIATPVLSVEQAQEFLAQQHDATTTHQCWAWKINGQSRINDDGEPSGTAGRPILAVIEGQQLDNVIVLVNRWYGGIKLGTGGLVRAYGGTAQLCLQLATRIERVNTLQVECFVNFSEWARVEHYLKSHQIKIVQQSYGAHGIQLEMNIAAALMDEFNRWLQAMTAGRERLKVQKD